MSKENVILDPSKLSNVELEEALGTLFQEAGNRELVAGSYWDIASIRRVAAMIGAPIPSRDGLEEIMRNVRDNYDAEDILEAVEYEIRNWQEGGAFRLHMNYLEEYLTDAVWDAVHGEHGFTQGRYADLSEAQQVVVREKVREILDAVREEV